MNTERAGSFRADPAALWALSQLYRSNGSDLVTQSAQVSTATAALHPDALGPVGSVLTAALVDAAGRHAGQVAQLGERLKVAGHTSATSADAFTDADIRVAGNMEVWR